MSTPAYPGRAIQFGETDADVVTPVQQRLIERGCGPLEITGVFDAKTRSAVRLFQKQAGLPADGHPTPELVARLQQAVR